MRIYLRLLLWLACGASAAAQVATNAGTESLQQYEARLAAAAATQVATNSSSESLEQYRAHLAASLSAKVPTNALPAPATTNQSAAAAPLTTASGYVLDDKHLLEPGDHLSFQIIEDRDPPKSLIVADSRELDVPYIGRVAVADKTCKQLAKELKTQLEKEYYYRATVIIGLDSVNKVRGKIYIWGQVHNQGAVDLLFDEKLTAGKAILRAGGFGDFANKKKVKVLRATGAADGSKTTFEVNMDEVLEQGKSEKDILLEPEDVIMVPARAVNF